ncbi:hypothetical protein Drose_20655 [Dactylosporangium roseum]|uniref:Uncharacterized protein n=1 Tax=Dactylosporangium roseum TaxID=47989 RepID=A0ABY5YY12_9ACTN|nr:hypothetical protein [Dactylosporangium roseum]UWZ33705.1 hypothetical protein Drose_20655 [Dactylosporangium roseum]
MSTDLLDLLAKADPAAGTPVGTGDADAVLARAARDITSYDGVVVPPVRHRAPLVVAAGLAALVVLGGGTAVLLGGTGGQPAAPPSIAPRVTGPGGPAACLAVLADRLRPAPYDGRSGRYEYVKTEGSSGITTQIVGKPDVLATATWSQVVEWWRAADGSGRLTVDRGPAVFADKVSEQYFREHPEILRPRGVTTEDRAPGELSVRPMPAPDPAVLAETLYQPRENGPSQALAGVADLNHDRIVDAAHRAAVLRFLAATDGITCGREETGADGRTSIRVTAPRGKGPQPTPGDQGTHSLVFDARTGELLASESAPSAGAPFEPETRFLDRGYRDTLG